MSLLHSAKYRADSFRLKAVLDNYDPSLCVQKLPKSVKTVTFVITRLVRFHGGQTSILHLGTELEKQGIRVCYLSCKEQSKEEMELCASSNLDGFMGRLYPFNRYMAAVERGRIKAPDVVVASSWDTVFFAKRFADSYKMYFVQDYEPYFYPFGEEFLMCRNTYEQGLHMVSLGEWNKKMILKERDIVQTGEGRNGPVRIDTVSFPYDSIGYEDEERDYFSYKNKKKIVLAVYLKYYGKRLPDLIPYMLENTRGVLKMEGVELEVLYFGEAKTFNPKGGRNLGQLSKNELKELYRKADFGMVASMSNISLVPYEMHASGLPVIEFADGSYPFFLGEDTALLTRIGEKDIAGLLLSAVREPGKIAEMSRRAKERLKELSWARTAGEFRKIMDRVILAE